MASFLSGIGDFAKGVAGGLVTGVTDFFANKELQREQNVENRDLWKEQMEYNKPENQIKRFRDAGLNPNLIYGQGSTASLAGPPPQMGRAEYQTGSIDKYSQIENQEAQNANIRAQVDQIHAGTDKIRADTAKTNTDTAVSAEMLRRSRRENNISEVSDRTGFPLLLGDPWEARGVSRALTSLTSPQAGGFVDRVQRALLEDSSMRAPVLAPASAATRFGNNQYGPGRGLIDRLIGGNR